MGGSKRDMGKGEALAMASKGVFLKTIHPLNGPASIEVGKENWKKDR